MTASLTSPSTARLDDPRVEQRDRKHPIPLLRAILRLLSESGCRYALVHPSDDFSEVLSSDVDIVFDRDPREILISILGRLSNTYRFSVAQCLHYEISYGYYFILAVDGSSCFLHVDCLCDPLGLNRYHLPTTLLLEDAVATPPFNRTGKLQEAMYLLMKRSIKGIQSEEQLRILRDCIENGNGPFWSALPRWFGSNAKRDVERLLGCVNVQQAREPLDRLRIRADKCFRTHRPFRYVVSLILGGTRRLRRLLNPTGLFVVVVGPDGSGKSTVTGLVASRLTRAFRKSWRFHWRPGLLPKLRRNARDDGADPAAQAPSHVSTYRGPVSLARFLYYWVDFVAGYWLLVYPRKARTTLVLGERYFPDVLVHPQRYGFAVPAWFMRLAARFVPSPDLIILLKDDPVTIHSRKPELPQEVIGAQIAAYEKEIEHWGNAVTITTTDDPDVIARRIGDLILEECVGRTSLHMKRRFV